MAINRLKIMLSFMRELNDGNIPTYSDYDIDEKTFYDVVEACQEEGLIKDVRIKKGSNTEIIIMFLENAKLTVKGMEYLNEHSTAMKTYKGLKAIRDWLPF